MINLHAVVGVVSNNIQDRQKCECNAWRLAGNNANKGEMNIEFLIWPANETDLTTFRK